ncbi:DUF805 domain-containing protein [Roseinatronobacter sp. HJB301]|uniref:DUF805 domain-containing protein n=2 Tax=Roseinatronobacter alkalisoli TaxID=3028235 RepID=A0ABT5T8R5_9RHOB|nr:DUF805 domain-containing protein [Roseinatronobacter sp. HJB301]
MQELLTSFEGRIGRGKWWLGAVVLIVFSIIFAIVVGLLFGDGIIARLLTLLLTFAVLYASAALATKRLADRGTPAMPRLVIFFGPSILFSIIDTFRIGYRAAPEMGGMGMNGAMMPGTIAMTLGFISLVVSIWALVELGILKGDAEENRFGPPPA